MIGRHSAAVVTMIGRHSAAVATTIGRQSAAATPTTASPQPRRCNALLEILRSPSAETHGDQASQSWINAGSRAPEATRTQQIPNYVRVFRASARARGV